MDTSHHDTLTTVLPSCLQVLKVNVEKERASLLYMKAKANRGSVDAVWQQMASHPQYLESFLRTQHYILHMDGPLPLQYRHYIAIMVGGLDNTLTQSSPQLGPTQSINSHHYSHAM